MATKEELMTPVEVPKRPSDKSFTEAMGISEPFLKKQSQIQTGITAAEGDILRGQQTQKETQAAGEDVAQKNYAAAEKGAMQQYGQKLEAEPLPAFIPTKDTAQDIAGLFSLIGVIGMIAGRGDARNAMGAMNGMLEGHRKGRADLYKQQASEFDKSFKAMMQKHVEFRKDMEDAIKLAATDKEAGMTAAKLAAVRAGSNIINAQIDRGDLVGAYTNVKDSQKAYEHANTEYNKQKQHAEDMAARERQHRETMAAKTTAPSDTASDVKNFLGVDFGKGKSAETKNDQVAGAANAMAEAMALSNFVRKNPEVVGRVGQAKSIIDKYVGSLDSSGIETDKTPKPQNQQEQEALLFAKRYAAYLIRYEQALAGSAKGFTVAFMKRFNDLMQSNQFNPEGFDNLMKEQIRELSARSSALSTKITEDNMMRLGIAQTRDPDALETYSRIKGQAAPAPGASNLDKERTKANAAIQRGASEEAVKQRFKQTTGQEL